MNLGIFKKDYESAGSGIAKNSTQKGAKLFFEILGVRFWKIIEVNLLYSLFYLPILFAFTFFAYVNNKTIALILGGIMLLAFLIIWGPATSGVFKIMKNFAQDKHAFIVSDFVQTFRENFRYASIIGIVDLLIGIARTCRSDRKQDYVCFSCCKPQCGNYVYNDEFLYVPYACFN